MCSEKKKIYKYIVFASQQTGFSDSECTGCPTGHQTRHFFNKFTTNENIATKFEADLPHCVRNVTTS